VHGLRKVSNPGVYKNFHSINTIIRAEILNINPVIKSKQIFCILGGGTVNVQNDFLESTLKIAILCFGLAKELAEYKITIQCSSINVYEIINENIKTKKPANLQLISTIKPPVDYYSNSSLIITRAGRNSLSELLFLNMPAISFISGCSFRKEEQACNAQYTQNSQIKSLSTDIQLSQFVQSCKELLNKNEIEETQSCFLPGNKVANELIINYLKNH
jgi:UDP-N-acetylglucosamine:LPS N-acetylglucosamine transferase